MELVLAALLIGLAVGWVMHRAHFCTMGAFSDFILFGSKTRLKAWFLAMALAIGATTILRMAGVIEITQSLYLVPSLGWLALILGGWLFGFGMVLAGGCASRNLVRLGAGSLKSLVVVLVMSVLAAATSFGWLSWLPAGLDLVRTPRLHSEGLGLMEILGDVLGGGLGLVFAFLLLVYCFFDRALFRAPRDLMAGVVLGVAVPLGWVVTGSELIASNAGLVPQSLGYLLPAGELLRLITSPFGLGVSFAILAWIGTFFGALFSALVQGTYRLETFSNRDDIVRHLQGGALMGIGGVLAVGCTIGQGLSGISTLAPASVIALAAMYMGCRQALRYLETGRFFRMFMAGQSSASSVD